MIWVVEVLDRNARVVETHERPTEAEALALVRILQDEGAYEALTFPVSA